MALEDLFFSNATLHPSYHTWQRISLNASRVKEYLVGITFGSNARDYLNPADAEAGPTQAPPSENSGDTTTVPAGQGNSGSGTASSAQVIDDAGAEVEASNRAEAFRNSKDRSAARCGEAQR